MMHLKEIAMILSCEVYAGDESDNYNIKYGCASDLMSDVLAFSQSGAVLLTGLATVQTIQTAYIAEISAVIFVRGKKPDPAVISVAKEKGLALLGTEYSMFEACGLLYSRGLRPTMVCEEQPRKHE